MIVPGGYPKVSNGYPCTPVACYPVKAALSILCIYRKMIADKIVLAFGGKGGGQSTYFGSLGPRGYQTCPFVGDGESLLTIY